MPWFRSTSAYLVTWLILCFFANKSSANLNNLVVANLNNLYTSYMLYYTEKDFKSVNFSTTDFGAKAYVGNALILAAGLVGLSFLPENSFCFLRGNCRPNSNYGYYSRQFTNAYGPPYRGGQKKRRRKKYHYSDNELYKRLGLNDEKIKHAKREANPDDEYVEYYDDDVTLLPAEHRQASARPNPRQQRSFVRALSQMIFGNPWQRMSQVWNSAYRNYFNYWSFRVKNQGKNYRRYLKQKKLQRQRLRHQLRHHQVQ